MSLYAQSLLNLIVILVFYFQANLVFAIELDPKKIVLNSCEDFKSNIAYTDHVIEHDPDLKSLKQANL